MDTDNPNLNNAAHDRREWWEAQNKKYKAQREQARAEGRMESNDADESWSNFETEMDAAGDWTEAKWDEFTATVSAWWNENEVKADHAI